LIRAIVKAVMSAMASNANAHQPIQLSTQDAANSSSPSKHRLSGVNSPTQAPLQSPIKVSAVDSYLPPTAPTTHPMTWYLIHTKPRQESVALTNLSRQGFECYLPMLQVEKIRQRKTVLVAEAMFPRYLFIRLDANGTGQSWSPIRSTLGVTEMVKFGGQPVTERPGPDGKPSYHLVCGEGRLNAFRILGETHIPALVVDVRG